MWEVGSTGVYDVNGGTYACTSSNGSSWSGWSTSWIKGSYVHNVRTSGYMACRFKVSEYARDGKPKYPNPNGFVRNVSIGGGILYADASHWGYDSGCYVDMTIYLLDVDPRTLNASQIASKALRTVTRSVRQKPNYANDGYNANFDGLSIPSENYVYVVVKFSGTVVWTRPVDIVLKFEPKLKEVSVTPSVVYSESNVTIKFSNRDNDPVGIKFYYPMSSSASNRKLLYSTTATSDTVTIKTKREWFDLAGVSSDEMPVGIEFEDSRKEWSWGVHFGDINTDDVSFGYPIKTTTEPDWRGYTSPGFGSYTQKMYGLTVTSPASLMVGEKFEATITGMAAGEKMTAVFKNGDTVLHTQVMTSNTISVTCPITWFTDTGFSAGKPMPVSVTFTDQAGHKLSASFTLNVPKLTITGNKNQVTTGLGNDSSISFTIENRTVVGRTDELLHYKITYGNTELVKRDMRADATSDPCVKDWFEVTGVRTSKTLPCTATVADDIGRVGTFQFTLNAGADMEPILGEPAATLIQPPSAAEFQDVYIAGYSKAKIGLTVTRQTSARITNVAILYNGIETAMAHNDANDKYEFTTFSALEGNTFFTIRVTDERGFVKTTSLTIDDVLNYISPSFKVNTLYRCDQFGDESIAGTFYMLNASAFVDENLPGNRIVLFTAEAVGGTVHDIDSDEDMILASGFETSKRITVRISIKDRLSNIITATWTLTGGVNLIDAYNQLVDKYYPFNHDLQKISDRIVGFPALMQSYYNTIDMELFLKSGLMPTISTSSTNAAQEAAKLTQSALSPVAVSSLSSCSATSAASAVLAVAKCLVRNNYQVKVKNSSYSTLTHIWNGNFTVTNYEDEEDTATSATINVLINSDLDKYVRQKIATSLKRESTDATDIESLFKLGSSAFSMEMGKYSLQRLIAFREACAACLDIMLQSGASNVSKIQNLVKYNTGNGNWSSANLLKIPYGSSSSPKYAGISEAVNGVRYSIGLDGSVTADNSQFYDKSSSFSGVFLTLLSYSKIGKGRYCFKGNATGTGVTMVVTVGSTPYSLDATNSRGIIVNVPDNATQLSIALSASRSTRVDNVTIVPVLTRVAGETDDGIDDDASEIVAYRPNTSITIRGVECRINNDGSITLNGTANGPFQFFFASQVDSYNLTRGYYMYSLNTKASGVGAIFGEQKKIQNRDSTYSYITQQCVYRADDYENGPFRVAVEGAGTTDIDGSEFTGDVVFGFSVDSGTFFSNYVIKPQLEYGSIAHGWVSPTVGAAGNTNMSQNDLLYYNLYQPYMLYLGLIEDEIKVREHEIEIVVGEYDGDGNLVTEGAQTILLTEKDEIQKALNFEEFLGEELWEEFASYRREDNLSNDNYISDGLNNLELFKSAEEFIKVAQREIYKSAEAQHSITGDLYNLLSMEEFQGIKDRFCTGNWIRVGVDGDVYKIRLYSYEIDYDNMAFDVEFTNLQNGAGSSSDVSDLLNRVRSMSVSYGAVARQAANGKKSKDVIDNWSENGMPLSTKIVSGSNNQEFILDQNGFSGKEYSHEENMYSPTQVKFGSNGIYATTDAWQTGKTVVGKYSFINPETGQTVTGYGGIAEFLLGYMLLTNATAIVSDDGGIIINRDGIKTKGMTVTGDLQVRGTKNRIAETQDFGDRLMYSYETASPMFGDVGEGEIGEDGSCRITLDEIFAQTISDTQYQVFLQCYGDGTCYVSERHGGFFIVCGTPGLRFGWELKGGQAGYDGVRLEVANEKEK